MKDGLGADLALEAELDDGNVRLRNLLDFLQAQSHGFKIFMYLTRHFQ